MLYEKKAQDIVAINISDKSIIADYFIICSGRSNTQVKSLCDEVESKFSQELCVRRKEGYQQGRWIVVDFGDILLHIFHPEERAYYNIERLWADDANYINFSEKKGGA